MDSRSLARLAPLALLLGLSVARADEPPRPPPAPPAPAPRPAEPPPVPKDPPKDPPKEAPKEAPKQAPKPFEGRDTKAVEAAFPSDDRDVLEQPDSLELLALHPYPGTPEGTPAKPEDGFQGYKVLGRAALTDTQERRVLVEGVYKGLNGEYGPAAGCFNPRHALRAKKGERRIDVLLCYQCETAHVFSASHTKAAGQQGGQAIVRLAKAGEDALDALLKAHDLKKHVDK